MIKKVLTTMGLVTVLGVQAQDVSTYTPGTMDEGVVYYLPKTQIEIKVIATRTVYTPGELCQYADRYLRLKDIPTQPEEHWSIHTVQVGTIGIPDPTKMYAVKLKDKSVASQVKLTDNGVIEAINTTPSTPKAGFDPLLALLETKSEKTDPRAYMTEEMLLAGSNNKMAELIAREIYNIRESKNSLTRGQADYMPQDGAALKIMLENLEKQEKALTSMFTGTTEQTNKLFTFYVEPTADIKDQVVFRFSKKLGMLTPEDLAGEPVYISVSNENVLPPADEAAKEKKKMDGIIYNIPGKAIVAVESYHKSYFEDEMTIAQFGETEVLVNSLFNKKVNTRVVFNPVTGGIVKIDKD